MGDEDEVRPSVSEAPEYDGQINPEEPEEPTAAHDGEPKEKEGNVTQFPGRRGKSAEELAGGGAAEEIKQEEEDDGQFTFLVSPEEQIKFAKLVKAGVKTTIKYKLSGQSIPNVSGGLLDPFKTSHPLVMEAVVDSAPPNYLRNARGEVEEIIVTMVLKPRIIQQMFSEAGQQLVSEAAKQAGVKVTFERPANAA